ncbi:O-antigen ligase family protein [Candidatus Pelagibacter sp.]|uniref:O-antigen ligase family protein n=1 Tax=Candidatus Pelagibacter sp. TaxID=2024849 RepID=UPI003F857442
MIIDYKEIKEIKPLKLLSILLLVAYPLALISGNLVINLFILLFSIIFFLNFKENKKLLKNKIFYLLVFYFISLIVNLVFSTNVENSVFRVLKIFFIICLIIEVMNMITRHNKTYLKYIFFSWSFIFFIVSMDIVFESIFGFNLIGIKSPFPGRIASFFGDELVAGGFYHGFILFFLSFLIVNKTKNYFFITLIICLTVISFLIGERSNFIKIFLSILIFSSIAIKVDFKSKIISFLIVIISLSAFLNFNDQYKLRYFDQLKILFTSDGYSNYLKESTYGAHRNTAVKIFKENFYFGVGIKNFRHEADKEKYQNKDYKETGTKTTHPHQVHHEILSETGIFGYISFLIFVLGSLFFGMKSYFKNRNLYLLSSIIFIITTLLPVLPSGSFLSTFNSSIFWINFAIMAGYSNIKS